MPLLTVSGLRVAVPDPDRLDDPTVEPVLVKPYGPLLPPQFVDVIRGVDLTVEAGETVGIVGESGSGKTLTVLGALGIQSHGAVVTDGTVEYDGVRLRPTDDLVKRRSKWLKRRIRKSIPFMEELRDEGYRDVMGRDIGVLFQHPEASWNPIREIGEQSGEVLEEHTDLPHREIEKRIHTALGDVKLPKGVFSAFRHQLSRGQAQRAMLASVLIKAPRLLIADEPTSGLDAHVGAAVMDLLDDMKRHRGMAMILITHDLSMVASRADRIVVMYGGRIVEDGPVRTVLDRPRHPYTAGLLASIPGLRQERLVPIAGSPPRLVELGDGSCSFAPRCPHAAAACVTERPDLTRDDGVRVACHRSAELQLRGIRG